MFKIFNSQAITRNQRFFRAFIIATPLSLILAIAYGYISGFLSIEFSMVFVGIGYLIGWIVQYFGHGVQLRFSILAAILAAFCFLLADVISVYGLRILAYPGFLVNATFYMLVSWFSVSLNGILGLAFRIMGIYAAYQNARIY